MWNGTERMDSSMKRLLSLLRRLKLASRALRSEETASMEMETRYGLAMPTPSCLRRCSGGGGDHKVDADTSPCNSARQCFSHGRRFQHAPCRLTIGA
jgi:hypothetical protein